MNFELLQKHLQQHFTGIKILGQERIFGGDINMAACVHTNEGDFFLKWNDARRHPNMFEAEFKGLELMRTHSPALRIPKPLLCGEIKGTSFLLMEFIENGHPKRDFWKNFAKGLSSMHKTSSSFFGLYHNNYMGSLPQSNKRHIDFSNFFISERLEPQIKLAYDRNLINSSDITKITQLYGRYNADVPRETPSLIHGDLWTGNYMIDNQGNACIYDPAAHFGHRESDLAMSRLFGTFAPEFYHYYNESFPLEPGWQERTDLFNLYPLLIHVNLFGSSYVSSVMSIVKRFL
ncbi:MAG: ketosamine-3-kinase [Marinilabiliales bacterium]|nr:MAG: ketosamine-3-kinase [Marinilabiliales bacterium]